MIFFLLAFFAFFVSAQACPGAAFQWQKFQYGLKTMNSTLLGNLFSPIGTVWVPAPSPKRARGPRAIAALFRSFFAHLNSINVTIKDPGFVIDVDGWAGIANVVSLTHRGNGQITNKRVVEIFQFDCSSRDPPPLLSYHAFVDDSKGSVDPCTVASKWIMSQFQDAMLALDAKAAASLFAANGTVRLSGFPSSTGPVAIAKFFGGYFQTLKRQTEVLFGPTLASGRWGALAKNETGYPKSGPANSFFTYNTFQLDDSCLYIQEYRAIIPFSN